MKTAVVRSVIVDSLPLDCSFCVVSHALVLVGQADDFFVSSGEHVGRRGEVVENREEPRQVEMEEGLWIRVLQGLQRDAEGFPLIGGHQPALHNVPDRLQHEVVLV